MQRQSDPGKMRGRWLSALALVVLIVTIMLNCGKAWGASRPVPAKTKFDLLKEFPELQGIKGPEGILAEENRIIEQRRLLRIRSESEFRSLKRKDFFVSPPKDAHFLIDATIPFKYRFARPEVFLYLENLAVRYTEEFGSEFKVSSLARTPEYQRQLARSNPNAVLCTERTPEHCSPHLTGYGFDISTKNLGPERMRWLAGALLKDRNQGRVAPIFERRNNFHALVIPGPKLLEVAGK